MSHPALNVVKQITKAMPEMWDLVEHFHQDKGKNLPDWDDKCYIPLAAAFSIVSHKHLDPGMIPVIAALAPWRISKEVYRFDPDLELMLYDQAGIDDDMPCSIFDQIPHLCIYVEAPQLMDGIHGFFVHFEHDMNKKNHYELRFLMLSMDTSRTFPMIVHLGTGSVRESTEMTIKESLENLPEASGLFDKGRAALKELMEVTSKAIQLVLYVCAQNAEVKENPLRIPRAPGQKVVDHGKEIRRWDVGLRIGRIIRASKQEGHQREVSQAIAKSVARPHPRRGHWHHYWTGPKSNPEKRILILKWVAPTFVGVPDDSDPAIINLIR